MLLLGSVHNGGVTICLGSANQSPVYVPSYWIGLRKWRVFQRCVLDLCKGNISDVHPHKWAKGFESFEGCVCRPSLHNKVVAIRLLQMQPNLEAAPHGPWPGISQNALKPDFFFFFFLCYSPGRIYAGESNAALHCLAQVFIFSHVMPSIGNISKLLFLQVDSSDRVKKQMQDQEAHVWKLFKIAAFPFSFCCMRTSHAEHSPHYYIHIAHLYCGLAWQM